MSAFRIRLSNFQSVQASLEAAIADLRDGDVVRRIWAKDHRVWKESGAEIENRLGWLTAPETAAVLRPVVERFAARVREERFERVLLLGMGGSSLAPEVFSRVLPAAAGWPALAVLDSTDPAAVRRARRESPLESTLVLVSSKSGTTLETASLFNYFFAQAATALGAVQAARRFVAVTDPGTPLQTVADGIGLRRVFAGDPDIGGRFSALSAFGLLPAALMGADLGPLLRDARTAARACRAERLEQNPGAFLGAVLGAAARAGRDKMALLLPEPAESFGAWVEQLVAESTGKEGRGILPLVRGLRGGRSAEPLAEILAGDGIFVAAEIGGRSPGPEAVERVRRAGAPLVEIGWDGPGGWGASLFVWEFAVAVAGRILGINPFDQPNVALAKKKTDAVLREWREHGRPPLPEKSSGDDWVLKGGSATEIASAWRRFEAGSGPADYLALQAFLPPEPDIERRLRALAFRLQARLKRPAAYDFGPRFLHSTGQLHKGDRGRGLFLQLTAAHAADVPIPDSPAASAAPASFGTLIHAQARGEREALREKGRRVMTVHLRDGAAAGLSALDKALAG